jgi:hypothetical protein
MRDNGTILHHEAHSTTRRRSAGKAEPSKWIRPKSQQRLTTAPPTSRLSAGPKSMKGVGSLSRTRQRTRPTPQTQVTLASFGFNAPAAAPRTPAAMRLEQQAGSDGWRIREQNLAQAPETPIPSLDLDYAGEYMPDVHNVGGPRPCSCFGV